MIPAHLTEIHDDLKAARKRGDEPERKRLHRKLTTAMADWQRGRWPKPKP